MSKKTTGILLVVVILINSFCGCTQKNMKAIARTDLIYSQQKPIILLPLIAEVHKIVVSEEKIKDIEWENILKKNIQGSLEYNIEKLGLDYTKIYIEELTQQQAINLAKSYIEFESIEKILIKKFNEQNTNKRENLIINYHSLPEGMNVFSDREGNVLFCKATDDYFSAGRIVKEIAIMSGIVVLIVLVVAIGVNPGTLPNFRKNYHLGARHISCTLGDIKTKSIIWYSAREINSNSKHYENVDLLISNMLENLPLKPN